MRLTQLQLSGFKSFAKPTKLEFRNDITAIVGPNGSGKSNVAESIRWALGEQSMKSLRGKRGEDLIFNGSPTVARMGKASVKLTFDNRSGRIPLDFAEVIFERKIFRDGINEYYLNDSQVRLKDVVELLARMGLGETKHNIIGQGEVDKVLLSGPRERREMLEEAMGLRVYQLKKAEAERKLEETSKNIVSAQSLLKEITPHLKFLRLQAEKAENREAIEQSLREVILAWLKKSEEDIKESLARLDREHGPEEKKLKALEEEIETLEKNIVDLESRLLGLSKIQPADAKIISAENERQTLIRELGRIEGKIEVGAKTPTALQKSVDSNLIRRKLSSFLDNLEEIHAIDDFDEVKERIDTLIRNIESLLAEIEHASLPAKNQENRLPDHLDQTHQEIQKKLTLLQKEIEQMREISQKESQEATEFRETIRKHERSLRDKEEERNDLRSLLQRWIFEKERIEEKQKELEEEKVLFKITPETLKAFDIISFSSETADSLRKKIEKYKIKLEEIGGIDPLVVKEFQETRARYEFLEHETADLESASRDLKFLVKELEETMEKDFESGFNKIKDEFNNYFRIIFGGGKGVLKYVALAERGVSEEGNEKTSENQKEYGIEINVDVPRKRVQSLTMLSGGEKALASIALLFAITAVNPPPFLVLDEADAALDEANSHKYAAILKELSKKTQLIIITHNRETMKQAGVLYGVTMASDGISKLLSLKFEEAEVYTNR
ncbi:MAG: AAA family ATPase [bacterium]|nr:AAA family ATPase [bacterium]